MQPVILEPFCEKIDVSSSSTSTSSDSSLSSDNETSSSSTNSTTSTNSDSSSSPDSDAPSYDFTTADLDDPSYFLDDTLFEGSSIGVIGAISLLMSWFASFPGISKQALGQLLFILHHVILPSGNLLPATYKDAFSVIQSQLVPVTEFHCYPNDCILYRGAYAAATHCPSCGEERYLDGEIPKKRFKYLPLASRVKRYFNNASISKLFQDHIMTTQSDDVNDIHQTVTWKQWYSQSGIFGGDARGLALSLCLDGTNPYSKERSSYSMWPMIVSFLNLPSTLRRSSGFLQLVGIIPGKKEPKNTDPYIQVLVDELKELNEARIFDAHQKNWFQARAEVVLNVMDYPGQNKVFHCNGKPAVC